MAINSISGTSRVNSLADLWAQKIQANKETGTAPAAQAGVSAQGGAIRVSNPGGLKVGGAQAAEETDNDDEYTRQIKELQKQLKRIMEQIARVKASGLSAEMKAQQVQALNAQALQVQGQISQVMAQQARAMRGGVSATA